MLLPVDRLLRLDYYEVLTDFRRAVTIGGDLVSYDRVILHWKPRPRQSGLLALLYSVFGGTWLFPYPPQEVEPSTPIDFVRVRTSETAQSDARGGHTWYTSSCTDFVELVKQLRGWSLQSYDDHLIERPDA